MQKVCIECETKIVGRADKKFCSDYCRNVHNNKLNRDTTNVIRNVNNRLRKNYRILADLNPNGKCKVPKRTLTNKGFDFKYYTHTYTTKKGSIYYFVYNFGYLPLEKDYYILVQQND